MTSFITCALAKHQGDHITADETSGGVMQAHGGDEKYTKNISQEKLHVIDNLGDSGVVYGRRTLKRISHKQCVRLRVDKRII
jgi:hypothetical protein